MDSPNESKGFYGDKEEAKQDAVPLQDEEIISFLESLPVESKHPRDKEAAKRWKFAFQLMAAFGLRPIEIKHLQVDNGELWCNYIKRSGAGQTKRRRLRCLNEWATEWDLINRVASDEALPLCKIGVADAAPALAERLIHLGLSPDVRPYAAIQAISECFKILQQGIIDKNNQEEINKIRTALEQLERTGQTDIIDV